jgi:hypothetical protein
LLELFKIRWLPYYLPHWSSRERSAARYDVHDGTLTLRIDADQEPWCPELDGATRVSSLQTGTRDGQHRFHPDAVVREPQEEQRLYLPHYGRIELQARASADPRTMVALWLIGFEDEPHRSAELCICEIFGRDLATVGMGLHPFGDPAIVDDFERVPVSVDLRESHVYAADWQPGAVTFSIDGETVKTSAQSPDYPLQLMLGLYEFEPGGEYPKTFVVERVTGPPAS